MTRERQEFYQYLKMLNWIFTYTTQEHTFLTNYETEIYFDGVTKLRSLGDRLKKEYEKIVRKEDEEKTTKI